MLHTESLPTTTHQGIYTPLRQAMSDSESDEEIEIHNASKHRQQQQKAQQQQLQLQLQQQQRSRIPPNTLALKSPHTRATATRVVAGAQLKTQQQSKLKHDSNTGSGNIGSGNGNGSSYTSNMQHNFRSVMLSDLGSASAAGHGGSNVGLEFSNFNGDYDADNVAILGNHQGELDAKRMPMSKQRRCCFIASLCLCLFAVVGFVWVIPCGNEDGTGACPAPVDRPKSHNWLHNYTKIELRGGVNVVAGLRAWENNVVFLCRGDVFYPEFRINNHKRNGILSLIGNSGAVAWYDETVDEPVAIDCTLLDVDGNGKPDCLVIDEYGELGVINSGSGQWHWRFMEHSARKLDAYDFPLMLPDLDGDHVLDILLISSVSLEQRTKTFVQQQHLPGSAAASQVEARNVLRLLSGRRGLPIGDGFRLHDCDQLSSLQLVSSSASSSTINYSCWRNNTVQQRSKTLAELYALITNKSIVGQRLVPASKISQHRRHGQRKEAEPQRNVYSLSGRELTIENSGKCPDCNVTIVLTESFDSRVRTVRNFTNIGMYGMVPAQLHFKHTKSQMSGFVIKFWNYHTSGRQQQQQQQQQQHSNNSVDKSSNYTNSSNSSSTSKHQNAIKEKDKERTKDKSYAKAVQKKQQQQQQQTAPQQRLKRDTADLAHEFPADREEFDSFEHMMPLQKRETFTVPPKNRSKANSGHNQAQPTKNYKMQMITETVILVLFIGADTRIENTSQSNIVQFCRNDRNEMVCQPDLINQENSMLIADLDMDGSQELVSYMSTFVPTDPTEDDNEGADHNWKLISYVRLLRIESEMPAFYEQQKLN